VGDPEHYKQTLIRALGGEADFGGFTIEKKADATYKVVSAASIIAKVTRDALLRAWVSDHRGTSALSSNSNSSSEINAGTKRPIDAEGQAEAEGADLAFGSGYPGDPKCVEW
jgi:ribonuclease H2 subunit A